MIVNKRPSSGGSPNPSEMRTRRTCRHARTRAWGALQGQLAYSWRAYAVICVKEPGLLICRAAAWALGPAIGTPTCLPP